MKIIISPAKNMKTDLSFTKQLTTPIFINKTRQILNTLNHLDKNELTRIYKCSDKKN